VDPKDDKFANVEYILLDPSCSGSGIVSRLDYLIDSLGKDETTSNTCVCMSCDFTIINMHICLQENNLVVSNKEQKTSHSKDTRLQNLSEFQTQLILHAFKCTHLSRGSSEKFF